MQIRLTIQASTHSWLTSASDKQKITVAQG